MIMRTTQRGFTLLELVVAIGIFAIISALTYPTLIRSLTIAEGVEQQMVRMTELQKAFTIIGRDVEQMVNRDIRDSYGGNVTALVGSNSELEFTRQGWRNPAGWNRSVLQRVSYVIVEEQLIRQSWQVLDRSVDTETMAAPLVSGVKSFEVRYLAPTSSDWSEYWPPVSNNNAPVTLPKAVEIVLELNDWGRVVRLFRVVG